MAASTIEIMPPVQNAEWSMWIEGWSTDMYHATDTLSEEEPITLREKPEEERTMQETRHIMKVVEAIIKKADEALPAEVEADDKIHTKRPV